MVVLLRKSRLALGILLIGLISAACSSGSAPEAVPTRERVATSTPTPAPLLDDKQALATAIPVVTPEKAPSPTVATPTLESTLEPEKPTDVSTVDVVPTVEPEPLWFIMVYPESGDEIQAQEAVRVSGFTDPTNVMTIQGITVEVNEDGRFTHDVVIDNDDDVYVIVLTASDIFGQELSDELTLYRTDIEESLPLSITYPTEGTLVTTDMVTLVGATRPDAIIVVLGEIIEVTPLGIFSVEITLEEGPNLLEVVATDLLGDQTFAMPVVFYEKEEES